MRIRNPLLFCAALASAAFSQEAAPPADTARQAAPASAPAAAAAAADTALVSADSFREEPAPRGEPPRARAITIHPVFSLAISGLNLSFEAPLGQGLWSWELPFYMGYNERTYDNPYFFAGSGFTARRYLIERGAGTYFAPSLDFLNVHRFEKGLGTANNILILAPNLRMGHRWTWKAFTMDASAGFFYYETILTDGERSEDDWDIRRGLFPMTQFALGVPF